MNTDSRRMFGYRPWLTAVLRLLVIFLFIAIILKNATSFTQSCSAGMTQERGETGREKREKDRKPLSLLPGAHRQSLRYRNANSLIQLPFFYGCLGSWSDHWTWHRRWWLGHWHIQHECVCVCVCVCVCGVVCVCVCVSVWPPPSPQQPPPSTYNRWHHICLWVSCHGYSLVAQRRSVKGRRG